MAFDLASISSKATHKPPLILLIAKEKTGKTCFCAGDRVEDGKIVEWGLNKPIIMSIKGEQGANDIPVPKFPQVNSYDDAIEALGTLAKEEHPFETLAIDSLTTLTEIIKEKVQTDHQELKDERTYNQYGNGNKIAIPLHRRICDALTWLRDNKNMTVIVTAHIKHTPKTIADPDRDPYDSWMADLPDSVWSIYSRSFDLILYADSKSVTMNKDIGMGKKQGRTVDVGNGQRFLFTKKTQSHPSGGRGIYGHLDAEIPFDWYSFQNAVAKAIAEANNTPNNNN